MKSLAIVLLFFVLSACVPTSTVPSATAPPIAPATAISPASVSQPPALATAIPPASASQPPALATAQPSTQTLSAAAQSLLNQSRAANPQHYQFALDQGAQVLPTADGKSFYVWWVPQNFRGVVIATLHGHDGWAFEEFFQWRSSAAQRGYAILALQWWFGVGDKSSDYYLPQEIYPIFETVLRQQKIQPGNTILHGFSRGSSNIYAVQARDRDTHNNFFGMTIANAGMASPDFPPNVELASGKFGTNFFAGTHWVLYCGERDPNPDRDGCPAMRQTRDWISKFGGTVDLLIEDKNGDHGGFHRTPANVTAALDVFQHLTQAR